jgi:hypothetical protein
MMSHWYYKFDINFTVFLELCNYLMYDQCYWFLSFGILFVAQILSAKLLCFPFSKKEKVNFFLNSPYSWLGFHFQGHWDDRLIYDVNVKANFGRLELVGKNQA